jgi:ATP-dependent Lon protease
MTRVILPAKNARDVDDVPQQAREAMEFIFADDMREVLAAALESPNAANDAIEPQPLDRTEKSGHAQTAA